ncbi:hypothetical protein DENIS_4447 [Desulfonema ishimotonii]|uniref:Tox-GHH domain-containing protein n=1 Tax=Desulfonema ishimotonii TaxID=45657 RepID=A0A401G2P7_9BACT|nr:RHS repeat-associated core domain-containing protein [Desulfonema ishimotonii]GBC63453.1 hypothetical protein DENIS_4447 [Desulfonema ishimotonii]
MPVIGGTKKRAVPRNSWNGPSIVSQYDYRYDALGRRKSVGNSGAAFAQTRHNIHTYNDRNELTGSVRKEGGVTSTATAPVVVAEGRLYEYDPIGNRTYYTEGTGPQVTYARNAVNQYTALTGGVSASPAYDHDGNMTAYDGATYTWNAENRLIAAETADKRITFLYDYMGRRVRKQVYSGTPGSWNASSDETRVFVYNGWNLIRETVTAGASDSDTYYVWGLDFSQGMQGAGGIGGLLCGVSGGKVRQYTYDANGNVGQLVDESGVIVAHYEYDPFGNEIVAEGTGVQDNPFRFSTKYLDDETGLYYYGFRYYSAELGRWLNRDPLEEWGGYNLYGVTFNNPLYFYDYLGLCNLEEVAESVIIEIALEKGLDIVWSKVKSAAAKFGTAAVADGPGPIGDIIGVALALWDFGSGGYRLATTGKSLRRISNDFNNKLRQVYSNLDTDLLKGKTQDCCNQFAIDMTIAVKAALGSHGKTFKKKLDDAFDGLKECCNPNPLSKSEIKKARERGVDRAKSAERKLIQSGHPGTADDGGWSWEERKKIAEERVYPKDTRWHHINSVKENPGLAEVADNVSASRGGTKGHVTKYHPNGTQAGSSGKMLNRQKMMENHLRGE